MTKTNVTKVTITELKSAKDYAKLGGQHGKDFKEVLDGVKKGANWKVEVIGKPPRVKAAYPEVNGHPGHVAGKDWKLYIERGKGSQDRLYVEVDKTKSTVTAVGDGYDVVIVAEVYVAEDTHK